MRGKRGVGGIATSSELRPADKTKKQKNMYLTLHHPQPLGFIIHLVLFIVVVSSSSRRPPRSAYLPLSSSSPSPSSPSIMFPFSRRVSSFRNSRDASTFWAAVRVAVVVRRVLQCSRNTLQQRHRDDRSRKMPTTTTAARTIMSNIQRQPLRCRRSVAEG